MPLKEDDPEQKDHDENGHEGQHGASHWLPLPPSFTFLGDARRNLSLITDDALAFGERMFLCQTVPPALTGNFDHIANDDR